VTILNSKLIIIKVAAAGESLIPYLYGKIIEAVALNGSLQEVA
jgi:hypothetical protein